MRTVMYFCVIVILLIFVFVFDNIEKVTEKKPFCKVAFPEKLYLFSFYAKKFCGEVAILLSLLFILNVILLETANFSLIVLWGRLPHRGLIVAILLAIRIYILYRSYKYLGFIRELGEVASKYSYPKEILELVLIRHKKYKEIIEKKMALLKALSPISFVLLLLNNLGEDTIAVFLHEGFELFSFVSANTLNIIIIIVLALYTYHLLNSYIAMKTIIRTIMNIELELCKIEHKDKNIWSYTKPGSSYKKEKPNNV